MTTLRRYLLLPMLVVLAFVAIECATPTALTVIVYSEVGCDKLSTVVLVGGTTLAELPQKAPSSVSTTCDADGRMGSVVAVPAGAKDAPIAFAVMQRADGQPADGCLDPAQASGCIVAKRQLRFQRHNGSDMRVDLRLSCLGVPCATDQTCVKGICVDAETTCGASCDELALVSGDGGSLPGDAAPGGANAGDGSATSDMLALTISPGALSPAFSQATLSYGVVPSVVSLGVPFTVTPTYASTSSVTINGTAVASGTASPIIALNLMTPTPIDVTFSPEKGASTHYAIVVPPVQEAYAKAAHARANATFGASVALAGDTLAVGTADESSNATGINGDEANTSAPGAGAVYIFTRTGATWSQQAYLKASNTRAAANFGISVALAGDTLAVGSVAETSGATGVDGSQASASLVNAGAVYVFARTGTTWSQQAYVKASNTRASAYFGINVALSGDTLAVGSHGDSSNSAGINGSQAASPAADTGAVYVFTRNGTTWSQQAFVKASNPRSGAAFGFDVAVDGNTLVAGSPGEPSNATGTNGNQADTSAGSSGAVYVFTRTGTTWSQEAYVKASNTRADAAFGVAVALSGNTLAAGSHLERSNATGINGDQADISAVGAGAVYVFTRSGTIWSQRAYVKASNSRAGAAFGNALELTGDTLAVGSQTESSGATGINGNQADTSASNAGAVYLFTRSGLTWSQQAYVKAANTRAGAYFGEWLALTGDTLAVGSPYESSAAIGVNGNQADTSANRAGAVYILR